MLTFIQFLREDLLLEDRYLYGINHTDSGAWRDVAHLAEVLGYKVERGSKHIQVHAPDTGVRVTTISVGTGSKPGRNRDALTQMHRHQLSIGGFSGTEHTIKSIKKAL